MMQSRSIARRSPFRSLHSFFILKSRTTLLRGVCVNLVLHQISAQAPTELPYVISNRLEGQGRTFVPYRAAQAVKFTACPKIGPVPHQGRFSLGGLRGAGSPRARFCSSSLSHTVSLFLQHHCLIVEQHWSRAPNDSLLALLALFRNGESLPDRGAGRHGLCWKVGHASHCRNPPVRGEAPRHAEACPSGY